MNEKQEIKDDIVKDAYYLVNLFTNDNNRPVTQLHVQKLMYLFEAYYMNKLKKDRLYDCEYQAWDFGPVAIPLYNKFKKYGRNNIKLTPDEIEIGNNISECKKELLNKIYDVFKNYTAMQLVNFTHAEGSPWKEAWDKKAYSIIPKDKIRGWFSKYVKK